MQLGEHSPYKRACSTVCGQRVGCNLRASRIRQVGTLAGSFFWSNIVCADRISRKCKHLSKDQNFNELTDHIAWWKGVPRRGRCNYATVRGKRSRSKGAFGKGKLGGHSSKGVADLGTI